MLLYYHNKSERFMSLKMGVTEERHSIILDVLTRKRGVAYRGRRLFPLDAETAMLPLHEMPHGRERNIADKSCLDSMNVKEAL